MKLLVALAMLAWPAWPALSLTPMLMPGMDMETEMLMRSPKLVPTQMLTLMLMEFMVTEDTTVHTAMVATTMAKDKLRMKLLLQVPTLMLRQILMAGDTGEDTTVLTMAMAITGANKFPSSTIGFLKEKNKCNSTTGGYGNMVNTGTQYFCDSILYTTNKYLETIKIT